jgi:hypothetical protein
MTSDLELEKWAVVSDRGCEATDLAHEDARRLVHRLKGEGRHGLCIMSAAAASRMNDGTPRETSAASSIVPSGSGPD